MKKVEGCGETDVSRLMSAFLGANLVGGIATFIIYFVFEPYANIAGAFGACLAVFAFATALAALVGFAAGAIRQGQFQFAFICGYIAAIPIIIFLYLFGNLSL